MAIQPITQVDIDAYSDQQKTKEADIEKRLSPTLKAFAITMLSEINLLRVQAGLPARTLSQLKDSVKSNL